MSKLKIAVLYGGKSTEHEVSVHSAGTVCEILEKKYDVTKIFINKQGQWFLQKICSFYKDGDIKASPAVSEKGQILTEKGYIKVDAFFPVLHGAMGEDGTMQGLFEILNTPYIGCGVLTSALGMDKELCKILAAANGVPMVPYIKLQSYGKYDIKNVKKSAKDLGYPLFVKPMSLGSSVGVSKVDNEGGLEGAINEAFKYERDILIEKAVISPREVFCGVIGGAGEVYTSLCGELVDIKSEFFDYKAKYQIPHGCDIKAPAALPETLQEEMRSSAKKVFEILRGCGLARVDFLLGKDGKYYFSEINTIPGLSLTSLFPELWQATGRKYEDVLDYLIELALKRHKDNAELSLER